LRRRRRRAELPFGLTAGQPAANNLQPTIACDANKALCTHLTRTPCSFKRATGQVFCRMEKQSDAACAHRSSLRLKKSLVLSSSRPFRNVTIFSALKR
jgi:hypothetical protein